MNTNAAPIQGADSLGVVADAIARSGETLELAARHLDPSLVDVLRILGFDEQYASAQGSYLYDAAGRAYLDFHTGEGFASLGHNHPDVREVLQATLAADLVDGVQLHYSPLAGMLAEALSQRLPQGLDAVFFASTRRRGGGLGDEVRARGDRPAAPDLVRQQLSRRHARAAVAGRRRVLQGGLRPAAARLRARPVRRPRALGGAAARRGRRGLHRRADPGPHGDAAARRATCRPRRRCAGATARCSSSTRSRPASGAPAGGSRSSTGGSSPTSCSSARRSAAATCRSPRWSRSREIYQRAVGTLERCYVHQSTFGRNRLSMAAGLATLRIIERDGLVEHAAHMSARAARRARRASAALRDDQGGSCQRADDRDRAGRAERARRPAELAPDPHGQRGAVSPADRDPAAPRPRRDHDGGRQERRDQAAAAADALRERGAQLPRRARRRARRLPRRCEQELGASCATSPRRRCAAGHRKMRR